MIKNLHKWFPLSREVQQKRSLHWRTILALADTFLNTPVSLRDSRTNETMKSMSSILRRWCLKKRPNCDACLQLTESSAEVAWLVMMRVFQMNVEIFGGRGWLVQVLGMEGLWHLPGLLERRYLEKKNNTNISLYLTMHLPLMYFPF